jgi:hypothetical protein
MPAFFMPDDQPDLSNGPAPVDINDMILNRDMNHAHAGNILRMLDGIRKGNREFNGAVLRMTIANAKNMAEAYLSTLDAVEAECRAHLAERERVLVFTVLPPAKPFGRRQSTGIPAVVSPEAF